MKDIPMFTTENGVDCSLLTLETAGDVIDLKSTVQVIDTTAKWYGITYKEDKQEVLDAIQKLVKQGVYPENLWKN